MPQADPDFIGLFTDPLEKQRVPYMITGATAAILYGQPRVTNDIDLVIELTDDTAKQLSLEFPEKEFYLPPPEVITVELRRRQRGHLNLIHHATGYKADLYLAGEDPLHRWALPLRRRVPHGDGQIGVAPPEYVILRKLEYFREGGSSKHVSDIQAILRLSGDLLDRRTLESWVTRLGLQAPWDQIRKN